MVALKPQILKTEAASLKADRQFRRADDLHRRRHQHQKLDESVGAESAHHPRHAQYAGRHRPRHHGTLCLAQMRRAKDRALAESLLAALGETIWVKREALIDAATAVSGSGPAYVFLLVEAMAEAAMAEGLPRDAAMKLARATIAGAGALLDADKRDAAELRRDVTSPGGTTEAALKILMAENGLATLMARAISAARKRAEELSK